MPNGALASVRDMRDDHSDRENQRGRGRGSFINYYKDLGFSTTEAAHKNWREQEDLYQAAKAKDMETINARRGQISAAESEFNKSKLNIPGSGLPSLNSSWESHKGTLVPFTVVGGGHAINPSNQRPAETGDWDGIPSPDMMGHEYTSKDISGYTKEGTYYLPASVLGELKKSGVTLLADGGGYLIPTNVKGQKVGNKIHDALRDAQNGYMSSYMSQAAKELSVLQNSYNDSVEQATNAYNSSKQTAYNTINSAKADLSAAEMRVQGIDQLRQEQLNDLRSRYQTRLDTLREIFSTKE